MARLEQATERLSQNVVGLATSLNIVGEITQRQLEVEKRALEANTKAEKAVRSSESATAGVLTIEEARRRARRGLLILGLILFLLIGYVRYESVQQIKDRLAASYRACLNTNERVETQAQIVEGDKKDPIRVAQANKLRSQKTDCKTLFGPQNTPRFVGLGDS